jgi:hypothetical protein
MNQGRFISSDWPSRRETVPEVKLKAVKQWEPRAVEIVCPIFNNRKPELPGNLIDGHLIIAPSQRVGVLTLKEHPH